MKKRKDTLSEKVNELFQNDNNYTDEDSNPEANTVDFDENEYVTIDGQSTDFRKKNVKLLSEQSAIYRGEIVSRKDLKSDDEDNEINSNDIEDKTSLIDNTSEDDFSNVEEDTFSITNSNENIINAKDRVIKNANSEAIIQKGFSVQNQLKIWEQLLVMRIQFQKVLNGANKITSPLKFQQQKQNNLALANASIECVQSTTTLLKKLMDMQNTFYRSFSDLKNTKLPTKRLLPEWDVDSEPPTKKLSQYLDNNINEFRPYRNTVLLKWHDRTKLLTPKGGKSKNLSNEHDVIQNIENALKNSSIQDVGSNVNYNIYNDNDFYHQLLRELIEYKSNTSSSLAEVTKQYTELQKLRQKMKKNVDTRASKGRKLRYTLHQKLVNFMAPNENNSWTDEHKNELYKSLFNT